MKVISLLLPASVAASECAPGSETCDSEFASALQTVRPRTAKQCLDVQRGDVAPIRGVFHADDGSFDGELVQEGDIAPVAGKFCVDDVAALVQRSSSKTEGAEVEHTLARKDTDFAIKSLGPFPLVARPDLTVTTTDDAWSVEQVAEGDLAHTLELSKAATYSWLGAKHVDWAYQPETAPEDAGSFEKYGGFLLTSEAGDLERVLEIDSFAAEESVEMTLEFSAPFRIKKRDWKKCKNPAPITIDALKEMGANNYCWAIGSVRKGCENGCFLYDTDKGYQGFAVLKQYPFKELGPFSLHSRKGGESDLVAGFAKHRNEWSVGDLSGKLATTHQLDQVGSNFWLQAATLDWAYQGDTEAEGSFEEYGGFVLLDKDDQVTDILEIGAGGGTESMTLTFSDPFWITKKQWEACQNPTPNDIKATKDLGVEEYCWFTDDAKCERGCFYYKTAEGYMAFSANGFAMQALGPFPLKSRSDLTGDTGVTLSGDTWTVSGSSGNLGSTLGLEESGSNFWFGAAEVDWAYQNQEDIETRTGLFEKYGGFLLKNAQDEIAQVMEIDVEASDPDMTLHFSPAFHISPEQWEACQNPTPNDIKATKDLGVEEYCWEVGTDNGCPDGCFFYKTTKGYQGFAAQDFAWKTLGPFQLVARDSLEDGAMDQLIEGRELQLDTEEEKAFWLGASTVTWMFPGQEDLNRDAATGNFEKYGGFILKDDSGNVVNRLEIDSQASEPVLTLNFKTQHIEASTFEDCPNHRAVTIQGLIDKGVEEYCWEGSEALDACQAGCFIYNTKDGYQAFSVQYS